MTELETKNRAHDKAFATLYTLDTDITLALTDISSISFYADWLRSIK